MEQEIRMRSISWVSALPRLGVVRALLLSGLLWLRLWRSGSAPTRAPAKAKRLPQPRTPRTPTDGADCVRSSTALPAPAPPTIHPGREDPSPRGRPKRIATEGDAWEYERCKYRGITDARIRAVVG